jgi:broad specificity phosphatase PhoE
MTTTATLLPDTEQIAAMPTRQLLAQLDKARAIVSADQATPEALASYKELQGRLKTELATREHVPGTLESKQARQARQARPEKKAFRY